MRLILRPAGRIVAHWKRHRQMGTEMAQLFLAPRCAKAVPPAAVAEQEHPRSKPVMSPSQPLPPTPHGVAGQLARVGAAGQQHQAFVALYVVHTVGNQPLFGGDEIVVLHDHSAVGQRATRMKEISEDFLLFRVDTEDRPALALVSGPQLAKVLELPLPLPERAPRLALVPPAAPEA